MKDVEQTFAELRSKFRTPIIAEVGGFRPPDDPRCSWLCAGCKLPEEEIPQDEGEDMFPVLQINCSELPHTVPAFGDTALLVVYFSKSRMPFDKPHGEGWLIREYKSIDCLTPLPKLAPDYMKPQPLRWSIGEPEPPGWEQSWDLVDMTPINESSEASDEFFDLPHHGRTKIGGFPTELQHCVACADDYVLQIGSEEKAGLNWIDSGVAYFAKPDGDDWRFDIQFY